MSEKFNVLIVDDEKEITSLLKEIIKEMDDNCQTCQIFVANTYSNAEEIIQNNRINIALLDIWLDNQNDGVELLKLLKRRDQNSQIIMISGHGNIEIAVKTIRIGAFDYIEKPIKTARLRIVFNNALNNFKLNRLLFLKDELENQFIKFVGVSKFAINIRALVEKIITDNRRILITGDHGTGKTLLAKYIHKKSKGDSAKFITIVPDSYNANYNTIVNGNFCGTIYFKEIVDFPVHYQNSILNFLNTYSNSDNIRIIASTSKNVDYALNSKFLNHELYLRLGTIKIHMENLNNRLEDVLSFCEFFTDYFSATINLNKKKFSEAAVCKLQNYQWNDNISQLKAVIEWVLRVYNHDETVKVISDEMLSPAILHKNIFNIEKLLPMQLKDAKEEFEKYYLIFHLKRNHSSITKTAESIGLDRSSLHRKLKSFGIEFEDVQESGYVY